MSQNFLSLYTELGDRLGLDSTIASNKTRLQRWINLIYGDIVSRFPFEFLYKTEIVQTTTQYTTGTVSISNGGTTVTGVGTTFTSSMVNWYIQFAGSTNWYLVTTFNSATSLTVSPTYNEPNVTNGTYVLRQRWYDLTSDVDRVMSVTQTNTPLKLTNLGVWTRDMYQPDITDVSIPTGYVLFQQDPATAASGLKVRQMGFFPQPDAIYNIEVKYFFIPNDLSADTDVPVIPQNYITVLLEGGEWMGSKYLNASEEPSLLQSYEMKLAKMIEQENSNDDYLPVLTSSDTLNTTRFLPFPSTFEQPR